MITVSTLLTRDSAHSIWPVLEIGSWNKRWPNSHLFPEQTIQAHQDLRGKYLLPIHWSVFDLAFHEWDEPIKRLHAAAKQEDVQILTPYSGTACNSWTNCN